jgi:Ca2+-binding EF-hand superfamily protein
MEELDNAKMGLEEVTKILTSEEEFGEVVSYLYNEFDHNEDGDIDMDEVTDLIKYINDDMAKSTKVATYKSLSEAEIKTLAEDTDTNKDKIIQKEELAVLVRKMLSRQQSLYQEEVSKLEK